MFKRLLEEMVDNFIEGFSLWFGAGTAIMVIYGLYKLAVLIL